MPSCSSTTCEQPAVYRRRHPERTVLYQVVQENLETWLAQRWEDDGEGRHVPVWVEREFHAFLDCGILARGFCRARCGNCGRDFVLAFSCKGRGICPSCNAKRMVQVGSHLADHVFPQVPVRQWVLSVPKRLRYFLHHDTELTGRVLRVFLRAVESKLRQCSPGAPSDARFGGVSFVQRFGSSLNHHIHYHSCLMDGVFSAEGDELRFHEATALSEADVDAGQQTVRNRVLALFARRAILTPEVCADMLEWEHGGGFSLDATIRVEAPDRPALERLVRYCARPAFARERLTWEEGGEQLIYELPKPGLDGSSAIRLSALELLDRLALLIPPPRTHRHRYCGVLAPNARLRAAVTAHAGLPLDPASDGAISDAPEAKTSPEPPASNSTASAASSLWAMLLARIYAVLPLVCTNCGHEMRIIAFITKPATIDRILTHIGEPTSPPTIAPARPPPYAQLELDQTPRYAVDTADPVPEIDLDQTNW